MTIENVDAPLSVDEYAEWNASQLKKQLISRRAILKGATGVAALAAAQYAAIDSAFAAAGGVHGRTSVAVSGRHLSFVPAADGRPTSAMAVTAQLAGPDGTLPTSLRAFVELGDTPGHYGRRIEAEIVHLLGQYAIPGGPVGSQYYLKATIDGLAPQGFYHYRIVLSDGARTGDAHFTTAPGPRRLHKPFTFTAFADVGTNVAPRDPRASWSDDPAVVKAAGGRWPSGAFDNNYYKDDDPVAGKGGTDPRPAATQSRNIAREKPVFTLLAGDICYADPSGSGLPADNSGALASKAKPGTNLYNPYVWDVFLTQIERSAAFTPWMFATGNHDMEALYGKTNQLGDSPLHGYAGHTARLDMPANGPKGCPSVYRFVYGNVAVISVDANELSAEIQTNTGYSAGAQVAWLEETLKGWRTHPDVAAGIDFVVVFFHHCMYSTTAAHASDGGLRATLEPLFTRYQVDLVIQGHNHVMERTDPIKHGKKTRSAPDGATVDTAVEGAVYYTIGSGGRPRYSFQPKVGADAPAPAGVSFAEAQALPEGQRYRGYRPAGGLNTGENNTENVVNSYFWSFDGTKVNDSGYQQGTKVPEAIEWSQVRYLGYAFMAVDVAPGRPGQSTTMTIRTLADALPGSNVRYVEIDELTLRRRAGAGRI